MRARRKTGCLFTRPFRCDFILLALLSVVLVSMTMIWPVANVLANDRPTGSDLEENVIESSEVAILLQLAIGKSRHKLRRSRNDCDRHLIGVSERRAADLLGLAACFQSGEGRPKSLLQAHRLFNLAAAQGSADAHLALGHFHRDGRIVQRDLRQAAEHFHIAARAGLSIGMVEYGLVVLRLTADRPVACEWFGRAAQTGLREGIRLLGDCFSWRVGERRDGARAIELYKQAARLGDRTAALKLAGHQFRGAAANVVAQEGCDWALRAAARYNQLASRAHAYCLSLAP